MPQFFPNVGANLIAELVQTELANSKIRLWQAGEITPSITTTRPDLIAAEADYTGYPAGGATIGTWFDPLLNPLGGFSTDSPKVQFQTATPFTVSNIVGGFWVETAAGVVVAIGSFDFPIPLSGPGAGFPLSASLIFPN